MLQKILIQVFLKFIFVLIAQRYLGFAKNDPAALNGINPVEIDENN